MRDFYSVQFVHGILCTVIYKFLLSSTLRRIAVNDADIKNEQLTILRTFNYSVDIVTLRSFFYHVKPAQ